MTKWSWFWFVCAVGFYLPSAHHYAQVVEPDMSKNPLFYFSVITLAGFILCFRMEQNFKSILLFMMVLVLGLVFCANFFGG